MKKISNEVKVGAATLLTLVVFIWLFNFLKGKDLLRTTANYYSVYDKIGGLEEFLFLYKVLVDAYLEFSQRKNQLFHYQFLIIESLY